MGRIPRQSISEARMFLSRPSKIAICWSVAATATLWAEDPKCPKGYQPYANRCVSQRMADYISCVEASGANQQRVATEVSNAQAGAFSAGAKGSGSGVVAKGSGSLVVGKSEEQALAKKFEKTWYSDAMVECRKVLEPTKQASKPHSGEVSKVEIVTPVPKRESKVQFVDYS